MDYDSDEGRRFGGINRWHHLECFVKLRQDLGFFDLASSLTGFMNLNEVDKTNLINLLPRMSTTTTTMLVNSFLFITCINTATIMIILFVC